MAGVVAVVSLLGKDMLGSDRLAGLGSAAFTTGSAIIAIPLAARMKRRGRRSGLVMALMLGVLGSAVAATGGQLKWFWLFIVGMTIFGCGQAATLQSRYVAADLARDDERATAIGSVVWVGTLGAVFGPLLTPFEKRVGEALGSRRVHRAVPLRRPVLRRRRRDLLASASARSVGRDRRHRSRTPSGCGRSVSCGRRTA